MSTDTDTAPDLTGAVAYAYVGDLARADERWYVTPERQVHFRRRDGSWTPASIMTADGIEASPNWQRVDT